ncbi:MAG: phasin family protein [Formosimonas sp.]
MSIKPEDFAAAQKASIENFFAITNKAFESMVKLTDLNIAAAKEVLAQAADVSTQVVSAKDAQGLVAIATTSAQPAADKALAYSKKVYEIASAAQSELSKFAEAQIAQNNQQVAQFIDSASKNAPQGSEAVVNMMKSAVASANTAYDSLTKAAKQAVEIVETNVNNAVKASAPKAK